MLSALKDGASLLATGPFDEAASMPVCHGPTVDAMGALDATGLPPVS